MNKKIWFVFWAAALVILFGFNGSLLITDSVESNYALTAKEMVLSGDWISPQIYGNYWFDKPVFFYWVTALGFKLFGFTEFAARFFPALFGLASLGLLTWGAKKLFDEKTAFYSGIVLLTSIEFFLISKSVITDSLLFLFFSSTLLFFYLGYSSEEKNYYYVMYASAALSTLTKGPIGFLLPGLIICLFLLVDKGWQALKTMKLISGTALFLSLALPWYLLMMNIHGEAFTGTFLGTHNFLRATVSEHPRDNVIYYYLLVNVLALFPWSGFLLGCFWKCVKNVNGWKKSDSLTLFLLIWAFTVFIFFQNMATKYITYTYPLLFPLALLLGNYLKVFGDKVFSKGYLLFHGLFYGALAGAAYWCGKQGVTPIVNEWLIIWTSLLGVASIVLVFNRHRDKMIVAIASFAFIFNLVLIPTVAVPLGSLKSGKELALELQKYYPNEKEVGLYGNYSTSAVFYSGKRIVKLLPKEDIDSFKPQAFSWSSKNVMPYAEIDSYLDSNGKVVVVQKKSWRDLQEQKMALGTSIKANGDWYIVK